MRWAFPLAAILGVLLLTSCAHREVRVDCDGNLTPINAPAPKAKPADESGPAVSRP